MKEQRVEAFRNFIWDVRVDEEGMPIFPSARHDEITAAVHAFDHVPRMSTHVLGGIIWYGCSLLGPDECYLNVGVWNGYSLLMGMAATSTRGYHARTIGVDNFSQFDKPEQGFREEYEKIRANGQSFFKEDFRQYLTYGHRGKIGLYLFDGPHEYKDQMDGLELAVPWLADGAVIIVDDFNWEEPNRATFDFMYKWRRNCTMLRAVNPNTGSDIMWWNGVSFLLWNEA